MHVVGVRIHPGFNPGTLANDLALLELARPVAGGARLDDGTAGVVGQRGDSRSAGARRRPRTRATSPTRCARPALGVEPDSACAQVYGDGYDAATMLCAGVPQGGRDTCQGDSGGPLVAGAPGDGVVIGFTSFGGACGQPGAPGAYVRASDRRGLARGGRRDERRPHVRRCRSAGQAQRRAADREAGPIAHAPRTLSDGCVTPAELSARAAPATQVSRTSAAVPLKSTAAARSLGSTPRISGCSRSSATRSAGAPATMPGAREPEAARAVVGEAAPERRRRARRRPRRTSTLRRPLCRRAQPSVSRASSNGSRRTFESEPKETGTPRSQSSRGGQEAVAEVGLGASGRRTRSTPRLGEQVELAVVERAWRARRSSRGAEHAAVVEVLDRAQAELLERLGDLARLLAGVDVQRIARRRPRAARSPRASRAARARSECGA